MWCTIAAAASDRAGDLGGATLLSSQRSHHRQTDLIKNRATHTISLHTASHFHPAENTWTDLRSTSRAAARLFPSLWFVGLGCYSACCSFNTDLVVASTNLGAPRNRRRSESDHRGKAGKLDAFRKGELVLVRWCSANHNSTQKKKH